MFLFVNLILLALVTWVLVVRYKRNRIKPPRSYIVIPKDSLTAAAVHHTRNILIVAGDSFGFRLADVLVEKYASSANITIFAHKIPKPENRNAHINYIGGDILHLAHIEKVFREFSRPVDTLYHTSSSSFGHYPSYGFSSEHLINEGAKNLIEACKNLKTRVNYVYISTILVCFDKHDRSHIKISELSAASETPINANLKAIATAERQILKAHNDGTINACVLRPTMRYGDNSFRFLDLEYKDVYNVLAGDGNNKMDFVHEDKVCLGAYTAGTKLAQGAPIGGNNLVVGHGTSEAFKDFFGSKASRYHTTLDTVFSKLSESAPTLDCEGNLDPKSALQLKQPRFLPARLCLCIAILNDLVIYPDSSIP